MRLLMKLLWSAARWGLALAMLLAPLALQGTAAPAGQGQPVHVRQEQGGAAESQDAALGRLASCVRQRRDLAVLILLDESGSLRRTDRDGLRVGAAGVAVDGLTRLIDPATAPGSAPVTVHVALAGFAGGVLSGPWHDLATSHDAIQAEIAGFQARNTGQATNYIEALRRARENLAGHAAARAAAAGGQAPCQALIWLTDGEPEPAGSDAPDQVEAHKRQLCQQGGPVDQLRASGVILLTVALTGDLEAADEEFLRAVTGRPGGGCGTDQPGSEGLYLAADGRGLVEAFARLVTGRHPVPLCRESMTCSFTLEPRVRTFMALIHSPGPGAGVLLRPPNGEPAVPLERPGRSDPMTASGANLRWDWHGESVLVRGQLPPAAVEQWAGTWLAVVQNTDGRVSGGQVYLFGNLEQRIVGTPSFVRGEPWRFGVEIVDSDGPVAATELAPVEHRLSVHLADGSDRKPAEVSTDPAGQGPAEINFTPPAGWHGSAVTVTVTLTVRTAGGIDISPPDLTTEIPVVTPLLLEPTALRLLPIQGRETAVAPLAVTAAETGGCVWVDGANIELNQTPAQIVVSPDGDASSAERCLPVAAGTTRQVRVRFTVERSWDGTVSGRLPVMMAIDGREPIRVDVPLSVSLVAVPDKPSQWSIFLVMLILSGSPLLFAMLWNNLVIGRFVQPRTLRAAELEFHVSGGRITPAGGTTGDWPARHSFHPVFPPPRHRFTVGPVAFRVRRSWLNPFASPRVRAVATGRASLATATAGPSRVIDWLPLNLTGGIAVAAADQQLEPATVRVVLVVGDEPLVHERASRLRRAVTDAVERHLQHQPQPAATG
jgi:hypothetical protein